jgi:coproporphyrinogen III oxidase-like Fe-S oxidoreductase
MFGRSDQVTFNISVDLIYGVPGMSNEKWKQNIEKALSSDSAYSVML